MRIVTCLLGCLVLAPVSAPVVAQTAPDSLPDGVTAAMVVEGETLFNSTALCMACHGPDGKGLTGPDLTDDEWRLSDGSYEAIVQQILVGVSADQSESGIPMMPKGGSAITEEQVRAVAAYVWSLSRGS